MGRIILLCAIFLILLWSEIIDIEFNQFKGLSIKNIVLYLLLLNFLINVILKRIKIDLYAWKIHFYFVLLIAFSFISWVFIEVKTDLDEYSKVNRLIAIKSYIVDYYLFFISFYYGLCNSKEAAKAAKIILAIICISNLITIMDVYNLPNLDIIKQMETDNPAYRGRILGPINEANQYAAFLCFILPSYLFLLRNEYSNKIYILYILAAVFLSSICLFLTGSRGGIFSFLVGTFIGILALRKQIKRLEIIKIMIFKIVLVLIALTIVAINYQELFWSRIQESLEEKTISSLGAGRIEIWKNGIEKVLEKVDSLIFGVGWQSFEALIGDAPHNNYLWHLFNLGLVGLIIYIALIVNILNNVKKSEDNKNDAKGQLKNGFYVGYICLIIANFFVDLYHPWYLIWAYTGIIMRLALDKNSFQSKSYSKYNH